jgi:magnesium transporter
MATESDRLVRTLVETYIRGYPSEAARALEDLRGDQASQVVRGQPASVAATLLTHMRPDPASDVIERLSDRHVGKVIAALDPARAAELLRRLPEDERTRRTALLDPTLARELQSLMTYPPESAGHLMDARVTTFRPDATVRQALATIRKSRRPHIGQVYVVDDDGGLLGAVTLNDLALAGPRDTLGSLTKPVRGVQVSASAEEVLEVLEASGSPSLPVVDFEGRLVGVIRQQGLIAAAREDATADLQTMVGVSKEERALSPPVFAVRKRLPWLQINLLTAFLAAFVVSLFEQTIAQVTALAVLLPIVAGQSGNTGAQALAVVMRGLALREIRVRHAVRIMMKELAVGGVNGVAVALVTALAVMLWSGSPALAAVIGIAMVTSMIVAGLAGAAIPLLLTTVGQDPAQSSSIILTTVTDVVGFLSFLGLATLAAGFL